MEAQTFTTSITDTNRCIRKIISLGGFGLHINTAPRPTSTGEHISGPLNDLDRFEIKYLVIATVIITHAIDKNIGTGLVATNKGTVTGGRPPFAGTQTNAGRIA